MHARGSSSSDADDGSSVGLGAATGHAPEEVARRAQLLLVRDMIARKREDAAGASRGASVVSSPSLKPALSATTPLPQVSPPQSPQRTVPVLRSASFAANLAALAPLSAAACGSPPAPQYAPLPPPPLSLLGATATAPAPAPTLPPPPRAWEEVLVSSPEAFNRVNLSITSASLSIEERHCCKLLQRARVLRELHRVCKKPVYYDGPDGIASDASCSSASGGGSAEGGAGEAGLVRQDSISAAPSPHVGGAAASSNVSEHLHRLFHARRPDPVYHPFSAPAVGHSGHVHAFVQGVVVVTEDGSSGGGDGSSGGDVARGGRHGTSPTLTWQSFAGAYSELLSIVHSAAVKGFAWRKLEMLEARFSLHRTLNADKETMEQKTVPHRDFYNCRKVDTHVHHSACMNQKHLLRFIKSKLRKEPDTQCIERDGKPLSLVQVFDSLGLTAYDLSIDTLDMHADWSTMHRFDRFNLKYSPVGQSRLREIFLKTNNFVGGRFLAELTREVFSDLETNKYQMSEPRISIYGLNRNEWGNLAKWVVGNRLSSPAVRWMIQLPRLYDTYKASGQITSFGHLLRNFFDPLFAVTIDPSCDPALHQLLTVVTGVDLVDDESKPEAPAAEGMSSRLADLPSPDEWTYAAAPPYVMWCWYVSANLASLNALRSARGFSQLSFRPHCGEAGDPDHLAAAYLTAESINHGILLRRSPALQYLYYLDQVGLAMSPLSNNRLFLEYAKNPFFSFFARGLHVSLSTDDPLMLHYTKEPLLEEYAVAAQVNKLSAADLAELARNSVLTSGFERPFKARWVGPHYGEDGPAGNDMHLTNVPHIRIQYRWELLSDERRLLAEGAVLAEAGGK